MNEEDDFGFSMEDDVPLGEMTDELESLKNENERLAKNLETMYNSVINLLENLKKDPDKPTIRWPNRVEVIDNFIERLEGLKD